MTKSKDLTPVTASDIRRSNMSAKEAASGPEQALVYEYRRGNLRAFIDIEGAAPVAIKLDMTAPRLSQVAGKNPSDSINEKQARLWEVKLGMGHMSFDRPMFGRLSRPTKARVVQPAAAALTRRASDVVTPVQTYVQPASAVAVPQSANLGMLRDMIQQVAELMDVGHILLDDEKVGRVLAVAESDTAAHNGKINVSLIGNLLKVLK